MAYNSQIYSKGGVSWSGYGNATQDMIDAGIPVHELKVYVDDLTADAKLITENSPGHPANYKDNRVSSLQDIVDKHTFIENPLDVFDSYTYNLEWFVVDREANRRFQLHESFFIKDIVTDNWPDPQTDNKVIIAKTGVTTEFNITDLDVESGSFGNSNYSKIAGVADKVSFTVTQVGETSLMENLQNAIMLCGFYSIRDAQFYIKINFVGHNADGKIEKINQTKVIPFTMTTFDELSTATDSRGTTTVIGGQVPVDKVVMDINVSQNDYGFEFKVGKTLKETLDTFFEGLNKSILEKNENLEANLKNTYNYKFSKQFVEEGFDKGSMDGISWDQIKNFKSKGKNDAEPTGQVLPNNLIYGVIEEICLVSDAVRKEQKRESHTTNKILKMSPNLVIKKGGYNPVQGTNSYDVEFFIDYEEKIIDQNMPNQQAKVLNHREIVQKLFDSLHVNKKYDYLFTGNNDQIIDFNISLDAELTKTYSTPDDYWAYDHFIKEDEEGVYISKEHQTLIDKNKTEATKLKDIDKRKQDIAVSAQEHLDRAEESYRAELIARYYKFYGHKDMHQKGNATNNMTGNSMPPSQIEDIFAGKSYADLDTQFENEEFMKEVDTGYMDARLNQLHAEVVEAQKLAAKSGEEYQVAFNLAQETYSDALTTTLNAKLNKSYEATKTVFKNIKNVNRNSKNMILAEDLDNDFISKLSNEDYKIILKSQATNPTVFKRLIKDMGSENKSYTLKPANVKDLEITKAKFYESKAFKPSMINAQITIKGDPYWLEGYMPPEATKREFGNDGGDREGLNIQTTKNGYNGMVLVSGIADGVNVHDNILRRNLITSLYSVHMCTSTFTGGLFTQTLTMVKNTIAEHFTSEVKVISAGELEEIPQIVPIITVDEPLVLDSTPTLGQRIWNTIIEIKEDPFKPITTYFNRTLGENAEQYNEEHEETAENYVLAKAQETAPNLSFEANALVRQNLAAAYLNEYRFIDKLCEIQEEGDKTSCESQINSRSNILKTVGIEHYQCGTPPHVHQCTVADRGDPALATAINTQVNDMLAANPNVTVSPYEVAAWQHAAGVELDICRPGTSSCYTSNEDKLWTERKIRELTGDRTPGIILSELKQPPEVDDAIRDNRIIDGKLPLNDEVISSTYTGTPWLAPYQNVDGSIKTVAQIDAEYEAIKVQDVTICDADCKRVKIYRLSGVSNDAIWARETEKKLKVLEEQKVKDIVEEGCVWVNGRYGIKDRTLECAEIPVRTLTDIEMNDANILSEEMNRLFQNHELTSDDENKQMTWTNNGYELLEREIQNSDLSITEVEKDELQTKIAQEVAKIVLVDSLSDSDYEEVLKYEEGINTIISNAQDGHRGDLSKAVNVGITEDELIDLSDSRVETTTKLNQYWWDTKDKRVFVDELESTEVEIAEKMLFLPDENMTAVATIINGTDKTFVPIYNPTKQVDVTAQPVIIKNADEQFDVVLAGEGSTYAGVTTQNNIDQLTQARNVYYALTSTGSGDMTTVEDDWGLEIAVKDFSNISPITYVDENGTTQTISDPSTFFDIHTTSKTDMYPAYKKDYTVLRNKVADLFPNIEVISGETTAAYLSTNKNEKGMIILNGTAFYINP